VNWLYGGYFCGWYVLFGAGYAFWLTDPRNSESWAMVAFGAFAYSLVIPGLSFSMTPVFAKLSDRVNPAVKEGFARGVFSRSYAFAVGLVFSLAAIVTCAVGWGVASLESDLLQPDRLGETGLDIAMISILMGVVTVIGACPWLGQLVLLRKCRLREPGTRQTRAWRIVPVALGLAWAATVGYLGFRIVNATSVMTARLDFAALPASDEPLQERLRSQPGIATAAVSREGNTVVVECGVSPAGTRSFSYWGNTVTLEYATPAGEKHTLHLTRVAAEAGYRGLTNAKFDQAKMRW
jgi:hypothetical protein